MVQGGNGRVGSELQLAVTVRLCLPRSFSSDTELVIRTACQVRRRPNKERPYELLIVMGPPPAAQHPFKIQIPFKSSRLCSALSCGSLSTASLQKKGSNGCFRKKNQLEAAWCPLASLFPPTPLSRDPLTPFHWSESNLSPSAAPLMYACHSWSAVQAFLRILCGPPPRPHVVTPNPPDWQLASLW